MEASEGAPGPRAAPLGGVKQPRGSPPTWEHGQQRRGDLWCPSNQSQGPSAALSLDWGTLVSGERDNREDAQLARGVWKSAPFGDNVFLPSPDGCSAGHRPLPPPGSFQGLVSSGRFLETEMTSPALACRARPLHAQHVAGDTDAARGGYLGERVNERTNGRTDARPEEDRERPNHCGWSAGFSALPRGCCAGRQTLKTPPLHGRRGHTGCGGLSGVGPTPPAWLCRGQWLHLLRAAAHAPPHGLALPPAPQILFLNRVNHYAANFLPKLHGPPAPGTCGASSLYYSGERAARAPDARPGRGRGAGRRWAPLRSGLRLFTTVGSPPPHPPPSTPAELREPRTSPTVVGVLGAD